MARAQAWRYRDWVIDAFNADMPYDQFVTEQLAGDEIPGSDVRTQIATTMLRLGAWDDEPADPFADRYDQLDDIVATTSAAFMGLTLRCARCHDHKFEPFSQKDYARWQAVFAPLKRPDKDSDREVESPERIAAYHAFVKKLDAQAAGTEAHIRTLEWQIIQKAQGAGRLKPEKTVDSATTDTQTPHRRRNCHQKHWPHLPPSQTNAVTSKSRCWRHTPQRFRPWYAE